MVQSQRKICGLGAIDDSCIQYYSRCGIGIDYSSQRRLLVFGAEESFYGLHLSLGSADIQVVVLGDGQVGYTHPNKVYGALFLGKPIIYIGPKESHVSDILEQRRNEDATFL